MIPDDELAADWRAARPAVAGVHLDSAACSRQSLAVIEAAARHARHEAEVGGYVAAQAAGPALDAGRAAIGSLAGMAGSDVVFSTGAEHALELLLGSWPERGVLACAPGEFGPNLAVMAASGFTARALPADGVGRVCVDALAADLTRDRPALLHLTAVPSHRGIAQPVREIAEVCAALEIPLVVDAAQAFGQIDCAVGADAIYSSSRKWLAGPRGVGFLAVRPQLAARLRRRKPPPDWDTPITALQSFEFAEANIAARVGYSVALGAYLAAGPERIRARLARIGSATRGVLDGTAGWRVIEPIDEPTAITTLAPPPGVDSAAVRARLLAEHRIVCTVAEIARAPFELTGPVLRISPHVDATDDDISALAQALATR